MEAFRAYIESEDPECNIIQINFNLPEYEDLLTYRALYDYVNAHYVAGKEYAAHGQNCRFPYG